MRPTEGNFSVDLFSGFRRPERVDIEIKKEKVDFISSNNYDTSDTYVEM